MQQSFDDLPECLRIEIFSYLTTADLGNLSCVSRLCKEDAQCDYVWKNLYPHTFTDKSRSLIKRDGQVAVMVNRPYGRRSVGWKVSVQPSPGSGWLTGVVIDYRNDSFLVRYDISHIEAWERETFASGPWHTSGKLRLRFIGIPSELNTAPSTAPASPLPSRSYELGQDTWLCENRNDMTNAPTRFLGSIDTHDDEVLSVCFSHSGKSLASTSRDGTTRVFSTQSTIAGTLDFKEELVIQHERRDVPCRLVWSPDDSHLLVCTEAKNGNIWDYDATVACYSVKTGIRLFSKINVPFDVCAEWLPNSTSFISGESLTISARGSFHQTLAVWDVGSGRCVGRFHFRFVSESFIHLIRVSPCGNFLAVTTGVGDALSDTVRVVPIPSLNALVPFVVRVPRTKYFESLAGEAVRSRAAVLAVSGPMSDGDAMVPSFFCAGAVLGIEWSSKYPGRFFANTRPYVVPPSASPRGAHREARPDLCTTLELQVWQMNEALPFRRIPGAHGFTTKDCPFYLFIAESPCGEYVASGSEDCGVYIYHVRHGALLRVLWNGHNDVVSAVAWSPQAAEEGVCLLASASDDRRVGLWTSGASKHKRLRLIS